MFQYEIVPLVTANIEVEKSKMTYMANYGTTVTLPTIAFYIKGAEQNILVDTGASAAQMAVYEPNQAGHDVQSFEEALETQGLKPEDIDIVIHTHLHHDHIGNTRKCKNAKVILQEAELRFALAAHPLFAAVYPIELIRDMRFNPVVGDTEIFPGIRVLLTPGHSPGTQSVAVETAQGTAIITGFCCIRETFEVPEETRKLAPKWLVYTPGCHADALAAFDNALKIKGMADILIPNHEPSLQGIKIIP
jgi:glyoxylase-like metal-dependent hydrolase (beta-lactamase superfamily II)